MTDHQQALAKKMCERMKFDLACNDTTGLLALCEAAVLLVDGQSTSDPHIFECLDMVLDSVDKARSVVARYGKEGNT